MKRFAIILACGLSLAFGSAVMAAEPFKEVRLVNVNGALTSDEIQHVADNIAARFAVPVAYLSTGAFLDNSFDKERSQFEATSLLVTESLFPNQKEGEYVIAIIPGDLFFNGFNFVFALTDYAKQRTVMGLQRLRLDDEGKPIPLGTSAITEERTNKLVLRRLGEMAGLSASTCGAMGYSNSLSELDAVPDSYCPDDAAFLKKQGVLR